MFNWRNQKLLDRFTFLPEIKEGSSFCTSLPALAFPVSSEYGRPGEYEVVSYCGVGLHFPGANGVEHLFVC